MQYKRLLTVFKFLSPLLEYVYLLLLPQYKAWSFTLKHELSKLLELLDLWTLHLAGILDH